MDNRLTIIIPYANEGVEVKNTVLSILEHSNNNVDIIVINDASDDAYNYERDLNGLPIRYILNRKRIGVAASRDLGVELCNTDYFLLLDAHMRFYDDNWVKRIIKSLDTNPNVMLCAQSKVLRLVDGVLKEQSTDKVFWGAYINLYSPINYFEPQWAYTNWLTSTPNIVKRREIPIVLGAGYATSKNYWNRLHGLKGLLSYGSDEILISLKIWLEGGKCILMPDVVIGHLYRFSAPYEHHSDTRIYNRLYIGYILCPLKYQKKLKAIQRTRSAQEFQEACKLFYDYFSEIKKEKDSFDKIKRHDFSSFEVLNNIFRHRDKEPIKRKEQYILKCIFNIISKICISDNIGLIYGKLGTSILLYHYARYTKNRFIMSVANDYLEAVIKKIDTVNCLNIPNGLLGIGWGISYLYQQKFICGDINDVLSEIDKKVEELAPNRMEDLNIEYGLGGVIRYVLTRLHDVENSSKRFVFNKDFLEELYIRAKDVIDNNIQNNCSDAYMEYILHYENKKTSDPASIYDILMLPSWNKYSKKNNDISLYGLTGMCLEHILSQMQ